MLAQAGIILVDKHHGAKFQTPPQFLSFDDRWNTIVRSCRVSKISSSRANVTNVRNVSALRLCAK
jgi:hypothetical protein